MQKGNMAAGSLGGVPSPAESAADSMMNDFEQSANRLGLLVEMVENRLARISRESKPEAEVEAEKEKGQVWIPSYFNYGRQISTRICSLLDRLESVLNRLEI